MQYKTVFLAIALMLGAPVSAGTITVSGQGLVSQKPDQIQMTFGISVVAATAQIAVTDMGAKSAKLLAELTKFGINDRNIQTQSFGFYQQYDPRPDHPREITGYEANTFVNVLISDINTFGDVIDLALKSGATELGSVAFSIADQNGALDQARALAVRDAARKASIYATAAGVELGEIVTITESGSRTDMPMKMRATAMMDEQVASGELSVTAGVEITYQLK